MSWIIQHPNINHQLAYTIKEKSLVSKTLFKELVRIVNYLKEGVKLGIDIFKHGIVPKVISA